jgi:NAD(P)H dehydrogenase (quinone)
MIVVTAATGKLGALVVDGLLAKVPAAEVAVAVRAPDKAKALAARGIEVRHADYAKPQTLERAFRSGDKVLLISSSEMGQRVTQHEACVAAAKRAGVALFAYTSILHSEHDKMLLAAEHTMTEKALRASDYAAAAVAGLTGAGMGGDIHELAGDASFTMSELAAEVSRQSGKAVVYKDLPVDEYKAALIGFGFAAPYAEALSDSDVGITRGELDDKTGTLRRLIGRPTTTLAAAVTVGLAGATTSAQS